MPNCRTSRWPAWSTAIPHARCAPVHDPGAEADPRAAPAAPAGLADGHEVLGRGGRRRQQARLADPRPQVPGAHAHAHASRTDAVW